VAASLRHPNIVRVFDSGVTQTGFAYLVMEFVEGSSLGEQRSLDGTISSVGLREKAALFAKVCEAVSYAHQRGVIHRDLKPGNIRVDAAGEPRVLDFGLAKVTSAEAVSLGVSSTGQFLGSLPWASPEQVDGNSQAVDVRSDVYSLGVMFYQLLSGRLPYKTDGGLSGAITAIRATPPAPLSDVPEVDLDLSTIVFKCLSKEPERRYQSAGELAADIRSWLDGLPIAARRDSAWYTLRTTAKRYRNAAWIGGVFALLVSAMLVQSVRERRFAERERDIARRELEKSHAVSDFVEAMLSSPDPSVTGRDVKVIDVLDDAVRSIDLTLNRQPASEAAVRRTVGVSLLSLGLHERALEQARLSEAIAAREEGPESDAALLARETIAQSLDQMGKAEEALVLMRSVAASRHRLFGDDHDSTIRVDGKLGTTLDAVSKLEEAEAIKRSVLERYTRLKGPEARATIGAMNDLATCLVIRGKTVEGVPLMEESVSLYRKVVGPERAETISAITNLASAYKRVSKPDKAGELLGELYGLAPRVFGPEHPQTLIVANNWADWLMNQNRLDEAEPIFADVIEIRTRTLSADHPMTLGTMTNLASVYERQGKFDKAEPLIRAAADRTRSRLGPEHIQSLTTDNNLVNFLLSAKRASEAEPLALDLYERAKHAMTENHWMPNVIAHNLGTAYMLQGNYEQSERVYKHSYEMLVKCVGEKNDNTTTAAWQLMVLYKRWGKPDLQREWKETYERTSGDTVKE
jgi:tetratricopeptide (TPR) repeat protein